MKTSFFTKLFSRKTTPSSTDTVEREYIAEALESRILYSAAPVEAVPVEEVAPAEVEQTVSVNFSGTAEFEAEALPVQTDSPNSEAASEMVTLTSLDNLTAGELATLGIAPDSGESVDEIEIPQSTHFENLTDQSLIPITEVAVDLWQDSGLNSDQLAALDTIEFDIVDLDGAIDRKLLFQGFIPGRRSGRV